MNHNRKIVNRLILYFSTTLLLFSIIIGGVFLTLFRSHTLELQKADLEERAISIAGSLSELSTSTGTDTTQGPGASVAKNGRQGSGGYGAYLHFLDEIAMADVWIVDENMELITLGRSMGQISGQQDQQQYLYSDLPPDADAVVKQVFQGQTTFDESFSSLLKTATLTVGTPIMNGNTVIGALLLHAPVEGMNEAVSQGLGILAVSLAAALILSVLLSVVFAYSFTKPLEKMRTSALQLAGGDYNVKTGVTQSDEIGELASAIDILSQQLLSASKEREQLARLRRDFVANISHELRTPVTVLRGSLEALCDEVVTDPDQMKSYHHQMLNESKYLQRLVNDLLDLSRLQNTDFQIEMQELNLCDVIQDAVYSAKQIALNKNVQIILSLQSPALQTNGDYGRLRQMFLIILDNAIKFSPAGGAVTVSQSGNTVSILDYGSGISQADLPYIFDRFYKAQQESNKDGTGLGLSIAKQIADRHSIILSASSTPEEGTVFQFLLNQ